jgi:hypothetical protein
VQNREYNYKSICAKIQKYRNNEIQKQKYLFFIEVPHFEKQILAKRYERNDILYVKSHNITLVSG